MRFVRRCKPGDILKKSGKRVAIIGAGPAGLGAAGELVCFGHQIDIYDMLPEPGGLLIFGIPEFRIPKDGIRKGIEELRSLGVNFILNTKVGVDIKLEKIINKYDAVLIASGTWKSRRLGIDGEDLAGVYYALEFIVSYHLAKYGYTGHSINLDGTTLVIGGGLTAIDACYLANEAGSNRIILFYRRTRKYSPAGIKEFNNLERNGIEVMELTQPIKFIGKNGKLKGVKAIKMILKEVDRTGRPKPEPIEGSEFTINIDSALIAIGEIATPPFKTGEYGIELTKWGTIKVDKKFRTTRTGVFAAGDVVTGPSLIGPALASGKRAAMFINEYLETGKWGWEE